MENLKEGLETRPCRYGLMSYLKSDIFVSRSLREYGEWAQAEIDFLLDLLKPGDTVLDIGAFIGTHTLAFAQKVGGTGKVYAFEPHPTFYEVLKTNIAQNAVTNVSSANVALSDRIGKAEVSEIGISDVRNFGGLTILKVGSSVGDSALRTVDVTTVDQLGISACDLIKIDVEDMEIDVLKGARELLRAARPIVFAECNSLEYGWPVAAFLKDEEYRTYLLSAPSYNAHNFLQNKDNFLGDSLEMGLVLVPAEKLRAVPHCRDPLRNPLLISISCIDDLALALLKKPQYKYDVMSKTKAAGLLGVGFWANETETTQLQEQLKAARSRANEVEDRLERTNFRLQAEVAARRALEERLQWVRYRIADRLNSLVKSRSPVLQRLAKSTVVHAWSWWRERSRKAEEQRTEPHEFPLDQVTPAPKVAPAPIPRIPRQTAEMAGCTIIAKNYISAARVLAKSFHEHNPDSPFFVLLIDRVDGYFDPQNEDFLLLEADGLPIPNAGDMFFKYSLLEVSTAVKPYFLEHLFREHELKKLVYLDPDILVTGSFSELSKLLNAHSIVLTPHLTAPYHDNLHPGELQILQDGTFNLGFIALRDSELTGRMLSWWQQKLQDHCYVAPDRSTFVDQKWMNLVPGLFGDTFVLRHPGYNIAYWNFHDRRVEVSGEKISVNGEPAYFFHFSGIDHDDLKKVSKHQNRFTIDEVGDIKVLFEKYTKLVLKAGWKDTKAWPFSYDYFENRVLIPAACRGLYRASEEARTRFSNPFGGEFFNWLNEDVNGEQNPRSKITRLWYYIYKLRTDVQLAYPDILGQDRELFAEWTARSGRFDYSVDTRLVPYTFQESGQVSPNWSPEPDPCIQNGSFGINVTGYMNSEKGVGEGVRSDLRALRAVGIPHVANNFEDKGSVNLVRTVRVSPNNPYSINLIHVNADQVQEFSKNRKGYFDGKYNIGYWAWELSSFPQEWSRSFDFLDEVWVPSTFTKESVASRAPIPVGVIPHCIDPDLSIEPDWTKERFGLDHDSYVFLYLFDFHSIMERKNPLGMIRAFRKAFGDRQDVVLCIKCAHSRSALPALNSLKKASHGANIKLLDSVLPRETVNALMCVSDCYVSLHRSEGFGLTISEAMSLGKPVIATGYSGNMDFMNESNSFPVRYKLVEIEKDCGPYKKGYSWAAPDLDHAAELMRYVFEHREEVAAVAQKGRSDVRERLHPKLVGSMIRERLIKTVPSRFFPSGFISGSQSDDRRSASSTSAKRDSPPLENTSPEEFQHADGAAPVPIPPPEMRQLVGPTDLAAFDNPTGSLVFPYLSPDVYKEVFDFGCGCGRVARQLILQRSRPSRYLGIDLHRGMINWCKENLQPIAPNFEFLHHDVFNVRFNPGAGKPQAAVFPAGDGEFTLVNATSVFTHLTAYQAEYYLHESARILRPDGLLHSSWFLFDKADFPMMQEFDNAVYVQYVDPSAAVIFDRDWLRKTARVAGLTICSVIPPTIKGFQWVVIMKPRRPGVVEVDFPPDLAPRGLARPPIGPPDPAKIGL